jgi:hypothetical protein
MSTSVNTIESYKEIFGQIKLTARMLQTAMFVHLEYLSNIERKEDVLGDPGLEYLFNNLPKGLDRGAVSAWWVKFSPLRPVFKGNGVFELVRWANKGKWDLEGADDTYWADCQSEPTAKPKIPEIERAIEALVMAAAKISKTKGTTVESLVESIVGYVPEMDKAIREAMTGDRVEKFAKRVSDYAKMNG